MIQLISRIGVTSAGGFEVIDLSIPYTLYEIFTDSEVDLASNFSITANGVPSADLTLRFFYRGDINLEGNSVNILGTDLTQAQLKSSCFITAQWQYETSPGGWDVFVSVDNSDIVQVLRGTGELTIPNTGTVTLLAGVNQNYQRSSNTVSLTGNTSVSISNTNATRDDWFFHYHSGGVTLGSFSLDMYGFDISAYDAINGGFAIYSFFDDSSNSWRSVKIGGTITEDQILDGSIQVDKFASIPAYSTYMNWTESPAQPQVVSSSTAEEVLKATGFGLLGPENFGPTSAPDSFFQINVSAAQIQNAFSSPVGLLDAPAAGTYNVVKAVIMKTTYGTTPYASNLDVQFGYAGATDKWATVAGVLDFAGSIVKVFYPANASGNDSNIGSTAFQFSVSTGNPTAGDSTIQFIVIYNNVSFSLD